MTRPMDNSSTLGLGTPAAAADDPGDGRFIYIAVPWTPVGGGMFKVADYLMLRRARCISAEVLPTEASDHRPFLATIMIEG